MLKNYIKIAFRNLLKFKAYTIINLLGLALGLSVGVLILLFVTDEMAYDKFHAKGERIYKIVTDNTAGGTMETNAWPVAHILKTDYPEVESVVYTRRASSSMMVTYEGKDYEHDMFYAGDQFFDMFSFSFLEGQPSQSLAKPYSMVITKEIRDRYFGQGLVVGKTLMIRDSLEFTITGVIENPPRQSHIQFDILASFASYERLNSNFSYTQGWGNFNVRNYLLLKEGADINDLQAKAGGMYMDKDNAGDRFRELGMDFEINFIPLRDIYLKADIGNGFGPKGSIDQVYLVSGIAIFVMLLACINFINLTTARSVYRAREVGLRKIVGSTRSALIWQFLMEAFLLTVGAFAIVALLLDFALPFFNQLMGKTYTLGALLNIEVMTGAITLLILVSLFSGYYPAWVLSGYKPVEVLKGSMQTSGKGVKLRRYLVVFQFFISGALVLATLVVLGQLDYMRSQDLGFDKEQILVLDATRVPRAASHEPFQNTLKTLNAVEDVSYTNALPGRPGWQGQWAYPETMDAEQVDTEYMAVDENYLSTLGLELIAGNNFDLNQPSQLDQAVIINETTVKEMGWQTAKNAVGKNIVSPSGFPAGQVIGVVKNFHGLGLQQNIWPQVMDYRAYQYGRYYAIRFTTGSTSKLVEEAETLWSTYLGDATFDYFFLNEDFDRQYKSEERLMTVFIVFAVLTVVIAAIGLLGLVSFMVVSRTKEIGIRKVLGADVVTITKLLSREFVLLVLTANLIAIPVVWYFGQQWLKNFAYHMQLDPVIFILTVLIMIIVAVATVSFQTIKAAMMNPVDTLRRD